MRLKSLTLALAALTMTALLASAGPALAQSGYRGYIGPYTDVYANDPYAPISRSVPPGIISLAKEYSVTSAKGRMAAYAVGEYLDTPEGRMKARRAENYLDSPRMQNRISEVEEFLTTPSYARDRLMEKASSGADFDFLANAAAGYLTTGQIDVVGNRMLVYQSGAEVPHSYKLRTTANGIMKIETMDGQAVGRVEKLGSGATISLPTHGIMVPLRPTNWMPGINELPSRSR